MHAEKPGNPGPATARAAQITRPTLPPATIKRRSATAPERTISGGQPIHPKVVRAMVEQQAESDRCFAALDTLESLLPH